MKVDVLLQELQVPENGTSLKSCPGLMVVTWMPPGEVQVVNAGGRKLVLKDNMKFRPAEDYRDQLELRANVTGKSWVEVQIVSMHDFGLLGLLSGELIERAKKGWPLPLGASLLDKVSEDVKKGAPQVIAAGRSRVLAADAIPASVTVDLSAPADVLGEMISRDPITNMPTDEPAEREVLLAKGANNGKVTFELGKA